MVFSRIVTRAALAARNITTSAVKRDHHEDDRNVVGSNLPFQIKNRYRLAAVMILYFGTAMSLPFLIVRNAILAKNAP